MLALIVILVAIGAVLALVALSPSDYRIERSVLVYAFRSEIFGRLDDLRRWADWSPWERLDPSMERSFTGPARGIGASYAWFGSRRVGAGRMTIIESRTDEVVQITLEFFRPYKAVCSIELSLRADSGSTRVTWTMTGTNGFLGKLFTLFSSMDKMVGRDFEKGLTTLKGLCEAESSQPARMVAPVIVEQLFDVPRPVAANTDTEEPTKHAK
jgi:hypothetical protein